MDDRDLMELYGLAAEEEATVPTESATEKGETGEEGSSSAGAELPGESEQEADNVAKAADESEKKEPTEPPAEQTREERARHAAARRRAETKAAVDAAVARETERFDRAIQAVGIPNPNNGGKPFESLAEIEAYKREYDVRAREGRMAKGSATPEDIRAIVSEMPEMKAAAAAVEKARAAEEAASKAAFEREVADQLQQIHALDPSVNTLEDILQSESAETFVKAVKEHHMNYYDAFRFANMDKLVAARQEDARREEVARQNSKNHLKVTTSRGTGAVTVPAYEMALYKQMVPDATEAEIRHHYGNYKKN